eukprot:10694745-Heterocapsa_arctica.AAC.1
MMLKVMEHVHDKAPARKKGEAGPGGSAEEVPRTKDGPTRGAHIRRQKRGRLAMHRMRQILYHTPGMEETGQDAVQDQEEDQSGKVEH